MINGKTKIHRPKNDEQMNEQQKQDFENNLKKVKDVIDKDKKDKNQGESQSKDQKPGENKSGDKGTNNAEKKETKNQDQAGGKKEEGKKGDGDQAAQAKDQGKQGDGKNKPSETKDKGVDEKNPAQAKAGDSQPGKMDKKEGDPKKSANKQPGQAQAKDGKEPKADAGAGKKGPPPQPDNPGQAKGSDDGKTNEPKKGGSDTKIGKEKGPDKTGNTAQAGQPKDGDPDQKNDVPMAKNDKGTEKGKEETQKGIQPGKSGPNGTGPVGEENPAEDPKEFNRGTDLQLDTLKERMTPEHLKNLGWTEQDWQKFLKDAKAYQDANRSMNPGKNLTNIKGKTAPQIQGTQLRPIDINPNAQIESLQTDRALPPPEFRDAQRRFSTGGMPEKK